MDPATVTVLANDWTALQTFVTDFADEAVVLPICVGVLIILLVVGWRRGALAWGGVAAGLLSLVLLLKLATGACQSALAGTGIQSPSGHTAAAAMIVGGVVGLLCARRGNPALIAFAAAAAAALLVGATRIGLGEHTLFDVAIATPIGVAAAVLIVRLAGTPPRHLHLAGLLLAAVTILVTLHGWHLHAESTIRKVGAELACPLGG